MSASGTVVNVAAACCGDDLRNCWRVTFSLDDPHALADQGEVKPPHWWAVDLPRADPRPPCAAGDRITISTHGHRDVTIEQPTGATATIRSEPPGTYDPDQRVN